MKARWTYGVAALLVAGMSQASQLEIAPRFWFPNLGGSVQVQKKGGALKADPISVVTDVIARSGGVPGVELNWKFGKKTALAFSYFESEMTGYNPSVRKTIYFHTVPTTGTFDFSTKASVNVLRAQLSRNLWTAPRWGVQGLFSLYLPFGSAEYSSSTLKLKSRSLLNGDLLPVPMLGLRACVEPIKRIKLRGEFGGLYLGDTAWGFDYDAAVRFQADKDVSLDVGYRMIKGHYQSSNGDLQTTGTNQQRGDFSARGMYVQSNIKF